MGSLLACLAFGAEARQVERTDAPTDVALRTQGPQFAEPAIVVLAWRQSGFGPDVLVQAVVTVGTVSGTRVGLALGHAPQVVLVEVFALEALLAQALEVVLADEGAVGYRGGNA